MNKLLLLTLLLAATLLAAAPVLTNVAAGQLNDMRLDARIAQARPGFRGIADEFAARHHLGDDEARAELGRELPERQIGDAGHRRQRDAVADRQRSDAEGVLQMGQIRMHICQAHNNRA